MLLSEYGQEQQKKNRKQDRPAEQSSSLREKHVDDHVDPADILICQIGWCVIESGKQLIKVVVFKEIYKPESAV